MKLTYSDLNLEVALHKDKLNIIVVENKKSFEKMIISLYKQIHKQEEQFIFSIESNEIDLYKIVSLITSPLELDIEKKVVEKQLYGYLEEESDVNGITEQIQDKLAKIIAIFDELKLLSDYDICFDDDMGMTDIFKSFQVHLKHLEGTFAEKFIEYAKVMKTLLKKDIFVIANCDSFLDDNDYSHIEKWAVYNDACIIFLNNRQIPLNIDANEIIIDLDLCTIF